MSTHFSAVPETLEWEQAYMAAVLEKDRTRIVVLIHDARAKLSAGSLNWKLSPVRTTKSRRFRMQTICFRL